MGNLVSELNVKRDREGSRAPLVLGQGEGLSMQLVTLFFFAGIWLKRGRITRAEFVIFLWGIGSCLLAP